MLKLIAACTLSAAKYNHIKDIEFQVRFAARLHESEHSQSQIILFAHEVRSEYFELCRINYRAVYY
jgi:hypothetical protein